MLGKVEKLISNFVTRLHTGANFFFDDKDYVKSVREEDLSVLTAVPTLCPLNSNPADLPDSMINRSSVLHPYF